MAGKAGAATSFWDHPKTPYTVTTLAAHPGSICDAPPSCINTDTTCSRTHPSPFLKSASCHRCLRVDHHVAALLLFPTHAPRAQKCPHRSQHLQAKVHRYLVYNHDARPSEKAAGICCCRRSVRSSGGSTSGRGPERWSADSIRWKQHDHDGTRAE